MKSYKINFVVDGTNLFSFDQQDTIADIFKVLSNIKDEKTLNKVALEIEIVDSDKKEIKEDFSESSELKSKLTELLDMPGIDISVSDDNSMLTLKFDDGDEWTVELSDEEDLEETADFILKQIKEKNKSKKVSESYKDNGDGTWTIWSASDVAEYQIPLVTLKKNKDGKFYAEKIGDSPFDVESYEIAQNVINTANKSNKDDNYILIRVDKTLNHNDPYFGVELNRSTTDTPVELLAAQALRTLRDDLKNFAEGGISRGTITEKDIANKFTELTGVNYYTEEVIAGNITVSLPDVIESYVDKKTGKEKTRVIYKKHTFSGEDQYNQLLILLGKNPKDKYNYITPEENPFVQRLKDLAEDLIEKCLLKKHSDYYDSNAPIENYSEDDTD